ncbi:hypothetical protein [Desulfovibrio sp. Fe33]|uniref:hypothetical protein n=1 Tax=Desulfovibrio sp. Fe33 TaxID=3020842 RepID=UPI00234DB14D|nr:hypothetical protein [Desulfovibrio sp. Fe33]
MASEPDEKRGEINGMSYGKLMTLLLIPKDSRSNPKRILGGIAFLAFVCFFVFGTMYRGCAPLGQSSCPLPPVERTVPDRGMEQPAPAPGGEG